MSLKKYIKNNDINALNQNLVLEPSLANKIIKWGPLNKNSTHPLHYLCDRVFAGSMDSRLAGEMAKALVKSGANVDGYGLEEMKDTPLVAAASLHADDVALVLIEAGADIHHRGCFGGTALHWAAWCGRDRVVRRLLDEEIDLDLRCITHKSTAFFWAAHGIAEGGEKNQHQQLECARMLKEAGADTNIPNINNLSAKELLKDHEAFQSLVS